MTPQALSLLPSGTKIHFRIQYDNGSFSGILRGVFICISAPSSYSFNPNESHCVLSYDDFSYGWKYIVGNLLILGTPKLADEAKKYFPTGAVVRGFYSLSQMVDILVDSNCEQFTL